MPGQDAVNQRRLDLPETQARGVQRGRLIEQVGLGAVLEVDGQIEVQRNGFGDRVTAAAVPTGVVE